VWEKAVTPISNLVGFQRSGMWPLDPAAIHLIINNGSSVVGVILADK